MVECLVYFALIGIGSFLAGRILPKSLFHFERVPFRSFPFEENGRIYKKLKVHKWKDKVPDMSRFFPKLMPSKKLPKVVDSARIRRMLEETCVAEWTHGLLCIAGWGCIFIWKGAGGWIISILYMVANLPFMIIQRYNRPKLVRLLHAVLEKEVKNR